MESEGPKYRIMEVSDLHVHPELTPPDDFVLSFLFERAAEGFVPVYQALVPLALVSPLAPEFKPHHPAFRAAVAMFVNDIRVNRFTRMWVYQRGGRFIMSDDYPLYYAYVESGVDVAACSILGEFECPEARNLEGPLSAEAVKQAMFGMGAAARANRVPVGDSNIHPDYGLWRLRKGDPADAVYHFPAFPVDHISVLRSGQFSTIKNYVEDGIEYAVSFDFDVKVFDDLLAILPPESREALNRELQKMPGLPMVIRFPVPTLVDITAVLGEAQQAPKEEFVPFIVQKISLAGSH